MKSNLAILGCGSLGYAIASCLEKGSLHLTNRNYDLRRKYQQIFPNVSADNKKVTENADIVGLFVRPEQIDDLIAEITPELDQEKLVVNFAAKGLELTSPLINVACSPVIDGRVKTFLYRCNNQVTADLFRQFQETFQPMTDYFAECNNPLKELGVMARVYCHVLAYYQLLEQESDQKALQAYFELATNIIKTGESERIKTSVSTKKGISDALFGFHQENLAGFVENEQKVLEERIRWMNKG